MKFCYLDESGNPSDPYITMAAVIVDSHRMGVTKKHWAELLESLSQMVKKPISEFHSKDFYSGKGIWHGLSGNLRKRVIQAILNWLKKRKHKVSFCGMDMAQYKSALTQKDSKLTDCGSPWCALGLHSMLIFQKANQKDGAKGASVVVFDEKLQEQDRLLALISAPPIWTDTYYGKTKGQNRLDILVDTPYFGKSDKVHLIQVADLIAYILRSFLEVASGFRKEKYTGEFDQLKAWVKNISSLSLPTASRYVKLKGSRCECAETFFSTAPELLRSI